VTATVFCEGAAELATLTNTFAVSGVATDPTTVTLVVTTPTGTATTYTYALAEITRTGAGVYTRDVACTEVGVWQYTWSGTGTASDIESGTWTVSSTALQRLYCTPAELKARLGISDALDDAQVLAACEAVARWIDNYCDRQFYRITATRTFVPCGRYGLDVNDLVSITTLKTDLDGDGTYETTWSATDYQLLPVNPSAYGEQHPYTAVKAVGTQTFPLLYGAGYATRTDRVEIAGVWGWPRVPDPVKHAAAIMAGDFLKLGSMAFGVMGYESYGAARARMSGPAVSMLDPYRRHPVLMA
jgi:hypothetical protein